MGILKMKILAHGLQYVFSSVSSRHIKHVFNKFISLAMKFDYGKLLGEGATCRITKTELSKEFRPVSLNFNDCRNIFKNKLSEPQLTQSVYPSSCSNN